MKKLLEIALHTLLILCLMPLLFLSEIPAQAQISIEPSENQPNKKSGSTIFDFDTEVGFEYSDNTFRLTESQKATMAANDLENIHSGRFRDMEALSDYIITPSIGVALDAGSPAGGDLKLTSRIKYNFYLENQKCSFPEGRIQLKNSIGEKGDVTLEGKALFGCFKKNYLSGYDDLNKNGNISKDERIYSPAVYDAYEGTLAYEYEVIKNKDETFSRFDIQPFVGYRHRIYNSSFGNRDKKITLGGLGLKFEFIHRIDLEMVYQYENVRCPNDAELLLFDETLSGVDTNGDGEIAGNAPLLTPVDRSSNRYTIEINSSAKLSKHALFFMGYSRRTSSYTSANHLDIDHYNKTACRQKIKSGIRYGFSKSLSAEIEYSRTDDDDEEDGDYSENNVVFTLKYDFT